MNTRLSLLVVALVAAPSVRAQVTPFLGDGPGRDLAGFTAAGGAGVAVDFDSVADNTAFEGMSVAGATFHGLGSPLFVVNAADAVSPDDPSRWHLTATSGTKVLSPGGKTLGFDAATQLDSVQIDFARPTQSFGFDLLFESYDVFSGDGVTLYDAGGNVLYSNGSLPTATNGGGDSPAGTQFYGFISQGAAIARVVITDGDDDATFHDNNIGFDTLRFTPTSNPTPEPGTWAALGLGTLAMLRRRKRA